MVGIDCLEHLLLRSSEGSVISKSEDEDIWVRICNLLKDWLKGCREKDSA